MNRTLALVALASLLAWAAPSPALAATHHSDLGYSITLGEEWTVMPKSDPSQRPQMVEAAFMAARTDQGLEGIPGQVSQTVKELFSQGKLDYYYSPGSSFNISVYEGVGSLGVEAAGPEEACRGFSREMGAGAGRYPRVYNCEVRDLNGWQALYLEADGYLKERKCIQYLVQVGKNRLLLFTAASHGQDLGSMRQEFDRVMSSLRMD